MALKEGEAGQSCSLPALPHALIPEDAGLEGKGWTTCLACCTASGCVRAHPAGGRGVFVAGAVLQERCPRPGWAAGLGVTGIPLSCRVLVLGG